jgi:serine/threonine-protein kinase
MAPEQARGESTDHRADLFSLGSTLYAMCTGHPPFRAESAVAVLRRVSDDTPRPVRAINPDVPEWLEALIAKLHAKDPAGRFQSAADAADLLSRCLAHVQEPLTIPLPGELVVGSAAIDVRRGKLLRRWAGALLLSIAAIGGGLVWLWPRTTSPHGTERGPAQSQQAARDTPVISKSASRATDEIEHEFADAWEKAQAVDSELHRSNDLQGRDPVSALARSLADRAGLLEQEIRPVRGAKP